MNSTVNSNKHILIQVLIIFFKAQFVLIDSTAIIEKWVTGN